MTIPTILSEAVKFQEIVERAITDNKMLNPNWVKANVPSLHSLIRAEIKEIEEMKIKGSDWEMANRGNIYNSALTAVQERLKSYLK